MKGFGEPLSGASDTGVCNYAWLLLLHATSAQSFDRLVQLPKYITRHQRGVQMHPPYPPVNPPLSQTFS